MEPRNLFDGADVSSMDTAIAGIVRVFWKFKHQNEAKLA
jgi:hypothetical protein